MAKRAPFFQSGEFGVSDLILTRNACVGDRDAFSRLLTKWHPRLYKLAYRLTGTRDEADEVMQESAIAIARSIRKLDDPSRFLPWCYAIIRRRAADHIRTVQRDRARRAEETAFENTAGIYEPSDEHLALSQALDRLNPEDRQLILLFYVDGFSGRELAIALNIPPGTVKSRLFRIRSALKAHLDLTS